MPNTNITLNIIDYETKEIECLICSELHTKKIPVLNPEDFTDIKKAYYDSVLCCRKCSMPLGIRISYFRDKKTGEVYTETEPIKNVKKIYKIKPADVGITIRPKLKSYQS